jgi:hypothetical protein
VLYCPFRAQEAFRLDLGRCLCPRRCHWVDDIYGFQPIPLQHAPKGQHNINPMATPRGKRRTDTTTPRSGNIRSTQRQRLGIIRNEKIQKNALNQRSAKLKGSIEKMAYEIHFGISPKTYLCFPHKRCGA